jgi:hypothetical protein
MRASPHPGQTAAPAPGVHGVHSVGADRWVSMPNGAHPSRGRGRSCEVLADAGAVAIGAFLAKHRAIESGRELTDTGEIARLWD